MAEDPQISLGSSQARNHHRIVHSQTGIIWKIGVTDLTNMPHYLPKRGDEGKHTLKPCAAPMLDSVQVK